MVAGEEVDWSAWIQTVAIVLALLVTAYQTRRLILDARQRDRDLRVERALQMYRDLVIDGETANAFHRFSVSLRNEGTRQYGRTTWKLPTDSDLQPGGMLDPREGGHDALFADLYRVLWYFERASVALKNNLLDRDVYMSAAGFHVWWWNQILRELQSPKAVSALRELAQGTRVWAIRQGSLSGWEQRCLADFNGGPSVQEPEN